MLRTWNAIVLMVTPSSPAADTLRAISGDMGAPPTTGSRRASSGREGGVFFSKYPIAPAQRASMTRSFSSYTVSTTNAVSGSTRGARESPQSRHSGQPKIQQRDGGGGPALRPERFFHRSPRAHAHEFLRGVDQ